jgi:hypothetical protein
MHNNCHRIVLPYRGFGTSMENMIEVLSGEASAKLEGNWIDVEEREPGVFTVVDDNLTSGSDWIVDPCNLGFSQWDDEVEDLDAGDSDESQCFGMSDHLRWNDVDLTPYEYRASSLERLSEALHHVAVCAWCPGDI